MRASGRLMGFCAPDELSSEPFFGPGISEAFWKRHTAHRIRRRAFVVIAAAAAAWFGSAQPAMAAPSTWDGGGFPNPSFSNAANWVNDIAPVGNTTGSATITSNATLFFAGTVGLTANNDFVADSAWQGTNTFLGSLRFEPSAGSFTITGNRILINTSNSGVYNASPNLQTINLDLNLTADRRSFFAMLGGSSLNYGGVVSETQTGAIPQPMSKTGSGLMTFNGAAPHTYTGPTRVAGGTLVLDFSNMPGTTPTNMINAASVLGVGASGIANATGLLQTGTANGPGTKAAFSMIGKGGAGVVTSQTFVSTTLTAGDLTISVNSGTGAGTTLNLGAITRVAVA
jgi:autotransporter-associated beta strand protein